MFGFVGIDKPELKVKDYETYRSVYCSLCKALGKNYSVFARFILNYDCTFLSLFLMSRDDCCPHFKNGRCFFNPAKRCNYAMSADNSLAKGAALTVITSYYKLLDTIADSGFFKKAGATMLRPFFACWHKKAKKRFPEYENAVALMYNEQTALEKNPCTCLDEAAEPTAKMLGKVFSLEGTNDSEKLALSTMGYHLGRWVYFMDAAADINDDLKSGNFNPFLLKYRDADKVNMSEINSIISHSCYMLTNAYNLIDKKRFKDILDNIIYSGLIVKQKKILGFQ